MGCHGLTILRRLWTVAWLLLAVQVAPAQELGGQDLRDLVDLPISEIRLIGLDRVSEQDVLNELRSAVGSPLDLATIQTELRLLERRGQFRTITPEVELLPDRTVALIYTFQEQPIVNVVGVEGNSVLTDQEILAVTRIFPPVARDDFQIQSALSDIKELYRKRGNYLVDVSVDESALEEQGVLIFRVIEGPRVRVKSIVFEGNDTFEFKLLHAQIETRTTIIFFRAGELDEDQLIADVATLDRYYKDRGFLDVRVDHRVELSPDTKEAKVTFFIEEGRQFRLRDIRLEVRSPDGVGRPKLYAPEMIAGMIPIKPGDVYSRTKIDDAIDTVEDAYHALGYIDAKAGDRDLRLGQEPEVDLVIILIEGERWRTGLVGISGNDITQDKVIRRELEPGIRPGRIMDGRQIDLAKRRLQRRRLFNDPRFSIEPEDPNNPGYRDVQVEIKERNTGSLNFGVAAGSDSGFLGTFSIVQNNFDVTDWPVSFDEWAKGRAFRGAGQQFALTLAPGNEVSEYAISLREPHILESDVALGGRTFYRRRVYRDYDEERVHVSASLGQRFGEIWNASLRGRWERVELTDIDRDAPVDVFEDAGPDNITSAQLSLTRTTIATITKPGKGSRVELTLEQAGVFGGDFTYTKIRGDYTVYFTVNEDFLGRKSTLRLNTRLGYILGSAPTYERFYMGGRSFRGFELREVSPKGIRHDTGELGDDPVGGDFMVFIGSQYEFPLIGETINGVFFMDTGTVNDGFGIDDYRVSIGTGIRLYVPQIGPVPLAFDFAFPILKADGDETQVLSFSLELPFN